MHLAVLGLASLSGRDDVNGALQNWSTSLLSQIDFYSRSGDRARTDDDFDWKWFEPKRPAFVKAARRIARKTIDRLKPPPSRPLAYSADWIAQNSGRLWSARELLEDEASKRAFDANLVLSSVGHRRFYYPRVGFSDFVEILAEQPFQSRDLPVDYLGLPLFLYDVRFTHLPNCIPMKVLCTRPGLSLINRFHQYVVQRDAWKMGPQEGDVVLDCGACIGEMSLLFAGLVGTTGSVHLFDPVSLHLRFCELQASLNPALAPILRMNLKAVGESTRGGRALEEKSKVILPGAHASESDAMVSIDRYCTEQKLERVDYIKMDVEGSEMAALEGASQTIRDLKPKLAISAYHKPEDLWEIPEKILSLNPGYRLFFDHHSPTQWESVYYAL